VRVPEQLQRAMAAEAEAAREARAKVIAAEGEHKASRALRHAAEVIIGGSPAEFCRSHSLADLFIGRGAGWRRRGGWRRGGGGGEGGWRRGGGEGGWRRWGGEGGC
jgi:hypothetical protein